MRGRGGGYSFFVNEIWYGISMGGFPSLTQCAQFAKLGVFGGNFPKKAANLAQIGCFSAENGTLNGPKIVLL